MHPGLQRFFGIPVWAWGHEQVGVQLNVWDVGLWRVNRCYFCCLAWLGGLAVSIPLLVTSRLVLPAVALNLKP